MGNFFLIKPGDVDQENLFRWILTNCGEIHKAGKSASLTIEPYSAKRTLSANSLYWIWMDHIAKHLAEKGIKITLFDDDGNESGIRGFQKEDAHDLCRSQFLGFERKIISKTRVKNLKSTRLLNSAEFCHYMTQVRQWAYDVLKLNLPDPVESEYREFTERNG